MPRNSLRPKVRASGLCVDQRGVVLGNHVGHPFWTLIGGSWEIGESLPEAVHREFMEELTLDVEVGDLIYIGEFHDEEEQILDIVFKVRPNGQTDASLVLETGGSLLTARFFPLEELSSVVLKPTPFWDIWLPVLLGRSDAPEHPRYVGRYDADN